MPIRRRTARPAVPSGRASLDPAIAEILEGLRRVVTVVEDASRQVFLSYGLTAPQLWLLRTLDTEGASTPEQLGRLLALSPAAVIGLAEVLARRGHLSRLAPGVRAPSGRLRISPSGRRLARISLATPQGQLTRALAALPEARRRRLRAAMADLVEALEAEQVPIAPLFSWLGR